MGIFRSARCDRTELYLHFKKDLWQLEHSGTRVKMETIPTAMAVSRRKMEAWNRVMVVEGQRRRRIWHAFLQVGPKEPYD